MDVGLPLVLCGGTAAFTDRMSGIKKIKNGRASIETLPELDWSWFGLELIITRERWVVWASDRAMLWGGEWLRTYETNCFRHVIALKTDLVSE